MNHQSSLACVRWAGVHTLRGLVHFPAECRSNCESTMTEKWTCPLPQRKGDSPIFAAEWLYAEVISRARRKLGQSPVNGCVRWFVYAAGIVVLCLSVNPAANAQNLRSPDLSNDPAWEGYRNRLSPPERSTTRQDFGYSATQHAGGKKAGEIGGWVQRSLTPARYWMPLERELSLDDHLKASGKLAVRQRGGSSGVLVGWFHESSRGWRTPNSLAFRIDGNADKHWIFFEYGTTHGRTGGMGCFEGDRYQETPTLPFPADGRVHDWRLEYDPDAEDGAGAIEFQVDDRVYRLPVRQEDRDDGAAFDRFGIWSQESTGEGVEIWLDDLEVNGKRYTFDADPQWQGDGNHAEFVERVVRPYHDYGYVPSGDDLSEKGSIGGLIFRDESPSYYGDRVGPLNLDDPLHVEGTIRFVSSAADSAVYLGWFNSEGKQNHLQPEYDKRQSNYVAILLEGPSRVGHYFRPGYGDAAAGGSNAQQGPLLPSDGKPHTFTLDYDPEAADGRGEIVVTLDNKHRQSLVLDAEARQRGATFDRFGLFNMQSGGWHVEVYLTDLRYTASRQK